MQRVLERGGHNLQIDVDRDQAFAWIGEFLHTHLLAAPAATGG
jgi:hypothetical protein